MEIDVNSFATGMRSTAIHIACKLSACNTYYIHTYALTLTL